MSPLGERWRRPLALVLSLCAAGCCREHDYEIGAASATCASAYVKTDQSSNQACHVCCQKQGASNGTVWNYGACKCFRAETEWYVPPLGR